eukprot:Skav206054  [mRNA]  locus=scaffold587:310380:319699:- [translate_table: standard]
MIQLPRSCLKGARGFRHGAPVRFAAVVLVACLGDDGDLHMQMPTREVHALCRDLWHLHGQVLHGDALVTLVQQWTMMGVPRFAFGTAQVSMQLLSCGPRSQCASLGHDERLHAIVEGCNPSLVGEWANAVDAMHRAPQGRRHFAEVWFLSTGRQHVCIRSRRVPIDPQLTDQAFVRRCLMVWSDHLSPRTHTEVVEVVPTPRSLATTVAHYIVVQGPDRFHAGVLLQCDAWPVVGLSRLRAVLTYRYHSVHDIFRVAQFGGFCSSAHRPCYIEDLNRVGRLFTSDEIPDLPVGALVKGDMMELDPSEPAHSDDEDTEDSVTTAVPDSDTATLCESEPDDVIPDFASLVQSAVVQPTPEVLPWGEIPLDYKLWDVFDGVLPSFLQDEVFSLMQRERSRSRDAPEPPAGSGDRNASHDEGQPSSSNADALALLQRSAMQTYGAAHDSLAAGGLGDSPAPSLMGLADAPTPVPADESPHEAFRCQMRPVFSSFATVASGDSQRTLLVATYYLSPRGLLVCPFARPVRLDSVPASWHRQVAAAWVDLLDPAAVFDIVIVEPHPPTNTGDDVFVARVLLYQHFDELHVPALVTMLEEGHYLHTASLPDLARKQPRPPQPDSYVRDAPVPAFYPPVEVLFRRPSWWPQPGSTGRVVNAGQGQTPLQLDFSSLKPSEPTKPVPLSLDATIECSSHRYVLSDHVPGFLWMQDPCWLQTCIDSLEVRLAPLPDGFRVPRPSYDALVETAFPSPSGWWELYIDGSTTDTGAAWSVVCCWTDGSTSRFVGCVGAPVVLAPDDPEWIGATSVDNIAAELSAMAFASLLALAWGPRVPVVIRPDLSLSHLLATATVVTSSNALLAQMVRVLGAAFPSAVTIDEVRGHTGHPWNDLADAVARFVGATQEPVGFVRSHPLHTLVQAPSDLAWTWLQGWTSLQPSFPAAVDNQLWQLEQSRRRILPPPAVERHSAQSTDSASFKAKIATINVLALDDPSSHSARRQARTGHTCRLDLQCHAAGLAVVGLQETRTLPGQSRTAHYSVFSSGGDFSHTAVLGCELWIHRKLPLVHFASGRTISADAFAYVVVHADPRRLCVVARSGQIELTFIVLHVPCLSGSRSIEELERWWAVTTDLCSRWVRSCWHFWFVDANSAVSQPIPQAIGSLELEVASPQSALFEAFVVQHRLAIPSTFASLHRGPSFTWTHARGAKRRRDYVLVSAEVLPCVTFSQVLRDWDTGFSHEDHLPAMLHLEAWIDGQPAPSKLTWNEEAFFDPVKVQQFQSALATLPIPTWDVAVGDHCDWVDVQLLTLAQQCFAHTPSPKNTHAMTLSESTLHLIQFKRQVLDYMRAQDGPVDDLRGVIKELESTIRPLLRRDQRLHYERLLIRLDEQGASLARARFPASQLLTMSVESLAGLVDLAAPMDFLHAARLRYFARLVRVCPAALWTWLLSVQSSSQSWISSLRQSFAWLHRFYPFGVPVAVEAPIHEWCAYVALDTAWKGRIRTTLQACVGFRASQANAKVWNQQFDDTIVAYGGQLCTPPPPPENLPWQCDLCSQYFRSKAALAMHSAKVHGYRNITHFFATDGWCSACCRDFVTRRRMRQHLMAAPHCLPTLQACCAPLPNAEVEELDMQDLAEADRLRAEGWHATKALVPRRKMVGPALPPPGTAEAADMLRKSQARRGYEDPAFLHLSGALVVEPEVPQLPIDDVVQALPPFIMQSAGGPVLAGGRMATHSLSREYARCHFKFFVVVHFFSGYRRDQDIHEVIDQQAVAAGVQVLTLSVDICMQRHAAAADLAKHSSSSWWLERVRSGQVVAAGGGPPCETFTAARYAEDGPRPVRSAAYPYGLPNLTAKEWKQVKVGTALVHFLLELLLELAWRGGCGWCEHPQWPVWLAKRCPASIWALKAVRLLKQFNCTNFVSFDQCVVGAVGLKPTTLLLVRLPAVRDRLLSRGCSGRCNHGPGAHPRLLGHDALGGFNTAKGKVYPPLLNQVLGQEMIAFVKRLAPLESPTFAEGGLPDFSELRQTVHEARSVVQADYHG